MMLTLVKVLSISISSRGDFLYSFVGIINIRIMNDNAQTWNNSVGHDIIFHLDTFFFIIIFLLYSGTYFYCKCHDQKTFLAVSRNNSCVTH